MKALRGVNLGGWFVLEKWMTPSLFKDTIARDEMSLSQLGEKYVKRIKKHHQEFIQEEDFAWIAEQGLEAIRVPVGYWIFGDHPPFVGAISRLDFAFEMAEKYNLKILLDIHAVIDSQNGKAHSGVIGRKKWFWKLENQKQTLLFLERLVERYQYSAAFWGIELLNEPSDGLLRHIILRRFYKKAYKRVRALAGDKLYIVISDAFIPQLWMKFMSRLPYKNVLLDAHFYQSFGNENKLLTIEEHMAKAKGRQMEILYLQEAKPVIVGEWAIGLPTEVMVGFDKSLRKDMHIQYAATQMASYNEAQAWFYWSYKMEAKNNWNFRHLVESEIIKL